MASILLRADIIFMLFLYRCIIQSMAAGTAFIPITFVRSQSIKFQIFIFSPQKQADAKSRKLRKFPILFDVHFDRYFSCPVNLPYGLYIQNLLNCYCSHGHRTVNPNSFPIHFPMSIISPGFAPVISGIYPFLFDLPVIIRRCSPDIQFHRGFQKFLSIYT